MEYSWAKERVVEVAVKVIVTASTLTFYYCLLLVGIMDYSPPSQLLSHTCRSYLTGWRLLMLFLQGQG